MGEAVVAEAGNRELTLSEPEGFKAIAGHGVEAQVDGKLITVGSPRMMKEHGLNIDQISADVSRLQEEGKTTVLVALLMEK